ncbi:MAG TPA: hypothetical protein VIK14_03160 [Ignavibacteria bacterium]
MKHLLKERLKDSIIDYIYDYCFNEKVQILKGGGITLTIDPTHKEKLLEDEVVKSLSDQIIHTKGPKSMKYGTRNEDYCKLVGDDEVNSNFLDRLERIGIKRTQIRKNDIDLAIQYLCDKSFLVRNAPIGYELILTKKGIQHFESGLSFEQNFKDKFLVRQANTISIISIIIAVLSVLVSIFIKS